MLPGDRCVTLHLTFTPGLGAGNPVSITKTRDSTLCFKAYAGRIYEARFAVSRGEVERVWLEDVETGAIVTRDEVLLSEYSGASGEIACTNERALALGSRIPIEECR